MKTEQILIRFSSDELAKLNEAYRQELIKNKLISRSEFVRRLIEIGIESEKK